MHSVVSNTLDVYLYIPVLCVMSATA